MTDVTRMLSAIDAGDPRAADELLPLVYAELRKLAAAQMAKEKPGQTLDATALVHEAYLRLVGERRGLSPPDFANRRHFFAAAAEAMRRILVEQARRKRRVRHGGQVQRVDLPDLPVPAGPEDVSAVSDALDQLAAADPPAAELVKLIYFAGLTVAQAAVALGLSERTAYRNWAYARAWLYRKLSPGGPGA